MQFDWWTFAFQLINVAVLMWLLSRFLFRPVARIIAERQAETGKALEAADAARKAAADAAAHAEAEAEKTAAARLAIIEKAKAEAESQRAKIVAEAHKEAEAIAARAEADADRQRRAGQDAHLRETAELAAGIAERLVANLPGNGRIAGYPERLSQALTKLDPEQRAAFASDPGSLRIVAPRPLDEDELAATRAAIRAALDIDLPNTVKVDPGMIAGLELQGRHGIIHNSLRHDLSRIAEAMSDDAQG